MQGRRRFIMVFLTGVVSLVMIPFRSISRAAENFAPIQRNLPVKQSRVTPEEEKIVRALFEEGWNSGNRGFFLKHPGLESFCPGIFDRYRRAFPDLRFNVLSIDRNGEEIHVRWSAQGTNTGNLDNLSPTNRNEAVTGLTRFRIANQKIVWATNDWDETGLKARLSITKS